MNFQNKRGGESLLLNFIDFYYGQSIAVYCKANVESGKCQSVNTSGFSLVRGAWVVGENADGSLLLVLGENIQQVGGEVYL